MDYLLSLDIGTTSVKAGLFNSDGEMLSSSLEEYKLLTPTPDQAELDPELYWRAAVHTLKNVIKESKIDIQEIRGITVSSQGETLILLDAAGKPLRNAIVWVDNRAASQAKKLKELLGEQVYSVTGIPEVGPTWPACKILWIKENEPEIFARAAKYLLVQDFIIYKLAGEFATDGSISCTTLMYDINSHKWWTECLQRIGVREDQLSKILPPGSVVGKLTESAAILLGVLPDTLVICGGMDQAVGAVGSGNISAGIVSETTGAALTVQVTIENPMVDPTRSTPVYVHSIKGKYLFVPVSPTAGMTYKWFKDTFAQEEIDQSKKDNSNVYDILDNLAAEVPPGSDGLVLLPHLMGEFSPVPNPFARGSFTGFTLFHGKGHFVRSVLESVAFMLRENLDAIVKAGIPIFEIRTSGGGSKSNLWNQIKSDVCNLPIRRLENDDSALLGDAILGGVACGLFQSTEDACLKMVKIKGIVMPGKDANKYNQFYQRYCDLNETLRRFFRRNYSA